MNKKQFLAALKRKLRKMSREEIERTLSYYEEIIADKIDGGMTERNAVASLGDLDTIAATIRGEEAVKDAKVRTHASLAPWVILLLVLGFPLWIGLAGGALGIFIGFLAVMFALFVSFVAIMAALLAGGVVELAKAVFLIGTGGWQTLISLGAGILLVGVGILLTLAVKPVAQGLWKVVKLPFVGLKRIFGRA